MARKPSSTQLVLDFNHLFLEDSGFVVIEVSITYLGFIKAMLEEHEQPSSQY